MASSLASLHPSLLSKSVSSLGHITLTAPASAPRFPGSTPSGWRPSASGWVPGPIAASTRPSALPAQPRRQHLLITTGRTPCHWLPEGGPIPITPGQDSKPWPWAAPFQRSQVEGRRTDRRTRVGVGVEGQAESQGTWEAPPWATVWAPGAQRAPSHHLGPVLRGGCLSAAAWPRCCHL